LPRTALLPLPNITSKSRNQVMHVTPPRSPSRELSILLWGSR
jgi:hypothetical protein